MKILVAGDWHSDIHEEGVFQAFKKLGHDTYRFSWHEYFNCNLDYTRPASAVEWFYKKFQNKFVFGPLITKLNRDFLKRIDNFKPQVVFLYRCTHITPSTLKKIKKSHPATFLIGYNNDNPFAKGHPHWLFRYFLFSIPHYDLVLVPRHSNREDAIRVGAKRVHLLRSWFMPERNYPIRLSSEDVKQFGCDVVFIGHYEQDGRLDILEEIVRHGFQLRLFGTEWSKVVRRSIELSKYEPVRPVRAIDYNKALNGAKVALCFLSKLNRDSYTRRCFEIPASGTMLLSEYSEDLATLYEEGLEADFFRSKEELIEKLKLYIENEELRKSVAAASRKRVIADGHDVISRMKNVLDWVSKYS